MKQLEGELEQERRMTESMVADMEPHMQEKFKKLKVTSIQLQEVTIPCLFLLFFTNLFGVLKKRT